MKKLLILIANLIAALFASGIAANYDFVFGWSTGHVGTTTLSTPELFSGLHDVVFTFEGGKGSSLRRNSSFVLVEKAFRESTWAKFDHDMEYDHFEKVIIPELISYRGDKRTLIDFGHQTLHYIHGLLRYFKTHRTYNALIVRIRRERIETAVSLLYGEKTGSPLTDLCKQMMYRYCPYDRPDDVILKPPNEQVWQSFTEFQKALWMIDEVEARWNQLIVNHPYIDTIEVSWAKAWPDSFSKAVQHIASKVGISVSSSMVLDHQHAGRISEQAWSHQKYFDMDREYRKAMNYSYIPG